MSYVLVKKQGEYSKVQLETVIFYMTHSLELPWTNIIGIDAYVYSIYKIIKYLSWLLEYMAHP